MIRVVIVIAFVLAAISFGSSAIDGAKAKIQANQDRTAASMMKY